MIIFQTAGGTGSVGLEAGLLSGRVPDCTTFRSNSYIHRLNRTLQAEMRVLSAYCSLGEHPPFGSDLATVTAGHQHAGRELVRLIIANRGIPEDKSALSFGLTKTLVQLCAAMPRGIAGRATRTTLVRLEQNLVTNYEKLLKVAPARDASSLAELLSQTKRHGETLASHRG